MASSSNPLAAIVSATAIARALGLSARRITQLRDEGHIPGAPGGKFVLGEAVSAYCAVLRGARSEVSFGEERAKLARSQREAQEMKNAVQRGKLIPEAVVEEVVGNVITNARTAFLSFPTRLAPLVTGVQTSAKAHAILTAAVHDLLLHLSDPDAIVDDCRTESARQ